MTLRIIPSHHLQLLSDREKFAGGFGSICKAQLLVDHGSRLTQNSVFMYKKVIAKLSVEERKLFERHLNELSSRILFDDGRHLESRLASPKALISQDDTVSGFLMSEFSNGCYFEKNYTYGPSRPSQRLLSDFLNFGAEQKRMGVPLLTTIARLDYVTDFWKTLSLLHDRGVMVGDISPYNLILQDTAKKSNNRRVVFVDVDSFHIKERPYWRTSESTLNWRAPEEAASTTSIPSQESDVYKGLLFSIRLMHHALESSSTSYSLKHPASSISFLRMNNGNKIAELVSQGLSDDPDFRPSAREIAIEIAKFNSIYRARGSNDRD